MLGFHPKEIIFIGRQITWRLSSYQRALGLRDRPFFYASIFATAHLSAEVFYRALFDLLSNAV
jgi:hypothetical protein